MSNDQFAEMPRKNIEQCLAAGEARSGARRERGLPGEAPADRRTGIHLSFLVASGDGLGLNPSHARCYRISAITGRLPSARAQT